MNFENPSQLEEPETNIYLDLEEVIAAFQILQNNPMDIINGKPTEMIAAKTKDGHTIILEKQTNPDNSQDYSITVKTVTGETELFQNLTYNLTKISGYFKPTEDPNSDDILTKLTTRAATTTESQFKNKHLIETKHFQLQDGEIITKTTFLGKDKKDKVEIQLTIKNKQGERLFFDETTYSPLTGNEKLDNLIM